MLGATAPRMSLPRYHAVVQRSVWATPHDVSLHEARVRRLVMRDDPSAAAMISAQGLSANRAGVVSARHSA
jgi:hypothetical protein